MVTAELAPACDGVSSSTSAGTGTFTGWLPGHHVRAGPRYARPDMHTLPVGDGASSSTSDGSSTGCEVNAAVPGCRATLTAYLRWELDGRLRWER